MTVKQWAKKHKVGDHDAAQHISEILEREISPSSKLTAKELDKLSEYELPTADAHDDLTDEFEGVADNTSEDFIDHDRVKNLEAQNVPNPHVLPADATKPKNTYRVQSRGPEAPKAVTFDAVDESEAIRQYLLMFNLGEKERNRLRFIATKVTTA